MSAVSHKAESSMSSEAFDLINCFYKGVDILVRELAEQIAKKQGSNAEDGTILQVILKPSVRHK